MIQSAIGFDRGFHAVSGVSASTAGPPEFDGEFSKDAADSPDGNTIPALRAALISRRISASEGAPGAICNLPSASTASDDASIRATTLRGCADAGLDFAVTLTFASFETVPRGTVAWPQPATPPDPITRSKATVARIVGIVIEAVSQTRRMWSERA